MRARDASRASLLSSPGVKMVLVVAWPYTQTISKKLSVRLKKFNKQEITRARDAPEASRASLLSSPGAKLVEWWSEVVVCEVYMYI